MEIYDRVQAETTKSRPFRIDWVGDAFKHDAWQNWSRNDKVETGVGRDWCLTETAFPKEVCAHGPLGRHGHVCLSRAPGRQAQHTLLKYNAHSTLQALRNIAGQGPGDRLAHEFPPAQRAVTSRSIGRGRTFWTGSMSRSFWVHISDTPRTWVSLKAFQVLVLQTHTFNRTEKLQSFRYNQILARFLVSL